MERKAREEGGSFVHVCKCACILVTVSVCVHVHPRAAMVPHLPIFEAQKKHFLHQGQSGPFAVSHVVFIFVQVTLQVIRVRGNGTPFTVARGNSCVNSSRLTAAPTDTPTHCHGNTVFLSAAHTQEDITMHHVNTRK